MILPHSTTVSAPGKVLLTGGYLVLDRHFSGLVVALDARFHVTVTALPPQSSDKLPESLQPAVSDAPETPLTVPIRVVSPQFTNGCWEYSLVLPHPSHINTGANNTHFSNPPQSTPPIIAPSSSTPANPFLETALSFTFYVLARRIDNLHMLLLGGLELTVLADNDFYSQSADLNRQGLDKTASGLRQLPVFNHTHGTISQVRKTGLGSSAAMTTSVVASLLAHFGLVYLSKDGLNSNDISTTADDRLEATPLSMLYNLAQTCHCVAQGKVGSGFDISAAVIGTHGYRRFSPEILDPVFRASEILAAHVGDVDKDTYCIDLANQVYDVVTKRWDWEDSPFQLPPGLGLMLGDVAAGSNTPKLVSMVLAWRKANSDQALALWIKIDGLNSEILSAFRELCYYARSTNESTHCGVSYLKDMAICSEIPAASWKSLLAQDTHKSSDTIHKLVSIHSIHQEIRECLRKMSEMSGAPIEPIEQTRLLDACMKVPGVLMGGVPGAGGYDAIYCIVLSDVARDGVCKVWHSWTEMEVVPLLQGESQNGLRCSKIPLQDL
ncbi:hypothetical protein BASA50_004868 [Batrachochytrium salamandrivorans]|uniref:Phosphomevalonate kinase n=1 Tax=Batrachochytrium salamandrivorans TaxID=1357716 RepID=A0ABQ8FEC9_9FUNG|nr:hypothetical protein BASA60_011210 [Batrachochytrium salamandrivorans]KAH6596873.1 hypothetical protein BASA50_004868 [Batrachochytrium salamandrivorans]KAH6602039.1 hypothetical protein BASA61_001505 [Batrachochytrium salamandrivorans]KAH9250361.1 phosphomevalonate kinase [Batrachochytrium salamandrivorans]